MIKQLRLKDYVLIDELTANFDGGLNIITGETGAGKSILINAIDLVFAPRVSKEVIKTGSDKAVIELVLENTKHDLSKLFEENGIDDLGSEIVISKEITQSSVRSRINGTLVSTELLTNLRALFVDIHSQHQTYSYMQPRYHITLLDSYGKNIYGAKLDEYKALYSRYVSLLNQLETAKNSANMTESQIEFLKFQINEIESAEIKSETEDDELNQELEVLENAEKLKELTGTSYWALNGDDNSIVDGLNKIKQNLSKASSYDPKLEELEQALVDASEVLKEVGSSLNSYSQNLYNDTERLNSIQERLFLLDKLKHKYGSTLSDVMKTYQNLSDELSSVEFSTANIDALENEINSTRDTLLRFASELSSQRRFLANALSEQIKAKLEFLELPKARFSIDIKEKELSADGVDNVEFMISTNVSEDLKPLAKWHQAVKFPALCLQ